jgi:hypothetical protein
LERWESQQVRFLALPEMLSTSYGFAGALQQLMKQHLIPQSQWGLHNEYP